MWDLPDEHSVDYPGSASNSNADSSEYSSARVRSDQSTQSTACFICQARDTIDQEISARWLTARLTNSTRHISQSQLFGVMRCPVHAWRIYAMYAIYTSHTAHAAIGASDIFALQHALNAIVQEFSSLAARLGRRGLHSHSIYSSHSHIDVMPACPLCDEAHSAVEQKALSLFVAAYAAASPAERQNLVWALCPPDHRLIFARMSQISQTSRMTQPLQSEAFPAPPTPRPLTDNDGWWQVPGHSTRGRPFVRSLLGATSSVSALPDHFCPLCWVQAHQEQMLAAVMRQGVPYTEGTEDAVVEVGGERWRFETALAWDIETLCSRHISLVRTQQLSNTPSSADAENMGNAGARLADLWNPSRWPTGALRTSPPEDTCPLCRAISGWDAVRQEGLLRAAGKTLLLEDITAQLREALKGRQTALCLPHWSALTTTADSEALETLLGWQFRFVWALQDRLDAATRRLNAENHTGGEELDAPEPRLAAYLFLAGYPR